MNFQAMFINSLYLLGIIFALLLTMTFILAAKDMIDKHRLKNKMQKELFDLSEELKKHMNK